MGIILGSQNLWPSGNGSQGLLLRGQVVVKPCTPCTDFQMYKLGSFRHPRSPIPWSWWEIPFKQDRDSTKPHQTYRWWFKMLKGSNSQVSFMQFSKVHILSVKLSRRTHCNWKHWMGSVSRLVPLGSDANNTGLEALTCLQSKGFKSPSPDGRQLCEPKIESTFVVNPLSY